MAQRCCSCGIWPGVSARLVWLTGWWPDGWWRRTGGCVPGFKPAGRSGHGGFMSAWRRSPTSGSPGRPGGVATWWPVGAGGLHSAGLGLSVLLVVLRTRAAADLPGTQYAVVLGAALEVLLLLAPEHPFARTPRRADPGTGVRQDALTVSAGTSPPTTGCARWSPATSGTSRTQPSSTSTRSTTRASRASMACPSPSGAAQRVTSCAACCAMVDTVSRVGVRHGSA